ncbi:hypothetical protein BX592_11185 [Paraburkholderia rhizosphaerae]|uniref:Uncharacterized protein n=1 Tax=Paraburkholderia rhizosphaerae TaxID=480658 RepID=A0A4R8LQK5_9BURK|nr:hypothetical protein BX592_11185 [Paraburkholderia rhizosphaerae]
MHHLFSINGRAPVSQGSGEEAAALKAINSAVGTADLARPAGAVKTNVVRHGAQASYLAFKLFQEHGDPINPEAAQASLPCALYANKKWNIIENEEGLVKAYKSFGMRLKESWASPRTSVSQHDSPRSRRSSVDASGNGGSRRPSIASSSPRVPPPYPESALFSRGASNPQSLSRRPSVDTTSVSGKSPRLPISRGPSSAASTSQSPVSVQGASLPPSPLARRAPTDVGLADRSRRQTFGPAIPVSPQNSFLSVPTQSDAPVGSPMRSWTLPLEPTLEVTSPTSPDAPAQ